MIPACALPPGGSPELLSIRVTSASDLRMTATIRDLLEGA